MEHIEFLYKFCKINILAPPTG